MTEKVEIHVDKEGIPCIVLEDDIEGMAGSFTFSILMDRKNINLKEVLKELKDYVNKNEKFRFFDL